MEHATVVATSKQAFFEISPIHRIKKDSKANNENEEEEKVVLVLKPFAAKPRMIFKGVLVGEKRCQMLTIQNPDPCSLMVDITLPNTSIQIESSRIEIPAKSCVEVELMWCPHEQGTCSETIQIKDSKGRRGTVSLSLEAIAKKQLKAVRRGNVTRAPPAKVLNSKPPMKARPAWHDPLPPRAPREVLKPVAAQRNDAWATFSQDLPSVITKGDPGTPIRRETFLVCGKENDGSPALPKTPALHDLSVDSLDNTPRVKSTKKVGPRSRSSIAASILKEFTLSPMVTTMTRKEVEASAVNSFFDPTNHPIIGVLDDIETPQFDARRCSTAFKDLPEEMVKKPRGVSPRELFNREMPPDAPEDRLSSATYIADRRASNETYIADRRASNETYVAEKRLSSDTYNLSNSQSFEGASGDSTMILQHHGSPAHRPFTPSLADVMEEIPEEPQSFQITQVCNVEDEVMLDCIMPEIEMSGIQLHDLNETPNATRIFTSDSTVTPTNSTRRKRLGFVLDSVQFTPFKDDNDEDSSQTEPRYNLRSAGKVVKVQEVQTVTSVKMDISPPKKFKLPKLGSTEKCANQTFEIKTPMVEQDETFVLLQSASSMYIPFGKKKLKLEPSVSHSSSVLEEKRPSLTDRADDILMAFAMKKMSEPGLQADPFYLNPLLSDAIISKFDVDFKKWLNSVLTPPEELESVDLVKVNAAEMWARSTRSADETLAPSKEVVSSRYLSVKSRLDQLRHASYCLFDRVEFKTVLCCVNSRVDSGRLKIRADKALHIDQGLKHGILGLFMSYNPIWLRIGLETVCGTLIPMKSNTDLHGLTYYLVTRVLSPEAIVGKSHLLLNVEGREKYNKFVTKKFLMLVYFLDKAKTGKLIRHDPCLFLRNSAVKSSKEMLLSFSRMLLAGEGDITKHLSYMGYKVSHKQGYLDEFNFSVKHLGVDLRDGVRITRVAELVTGTNELRKKLRVPAVSRLQKIYNVDVALKGLESAGLAINNLTAADIVMGHREKTLSMIWQIIHNFQVPRFEKAAKLIQQWWLRPTLKTIVDRRISKKKLVNATVVFQKYTRGFLCRKHIENLKNELRMEKVHNQSARVIQKACRQFFLRKRVALLSRKVKEDRAARTIQSAFKVLRAQQQLQHLRVEAAIREAALRETAALKLQAHFRRLLAQRQLETLKIEFGRREKAAVTIQCFWRCTRAVQLLSKLQFEKIVRNQAATVLQAHWRGKLARDELKKLQIEHFEKLTLAASILQRAWRCSVARRELLKLQIENEQRRCLAALAIQSAFRGFLAKKELELLRSRRASAVCIQCAWKSWKARCLLQNLRREEQERRMQEACLKIQCAWRSFSARKVLACLIEEELAKKNSAALNIQCAWRCFLAHQSLQTLKHLHEVKRLNAAVRIQCSWRCFSARRVLKQLQEEAELKKANLAALKVQCAWKCFVARKVLACLVAEDLAKKNSAALNIQCAWRCFVAQKSLQTLKHLHELKRLNAAVRIQCSWRCFSARQVLKQLQEEAELKKSNLAALKIQCAWKCFVARKVLAYLVEEDLSKKNSAALNIQCTWRCFVARRCLQTLKRLLELKRQNAALTLQCAWRMHTAHKTLHRLKEAARREAAAVTIQCLWRSFSARRVLRQLQKEAELKKWNLAAVKIQCAWKCFAARQLLASLVKQELDRKTGAATVIQNSWRCLCARKQLQLLKVELAQKRNSAAATIQSAWRCFSAKKRLSCLRREEHTRRCRAAVKIQSFYRLILAHRFLEKLKLEHRHKIERAATIVQSQWRGFAARKILKQEKRNKAAVLIQTRWRMHSAQNLLSRLKLERQELLTHSATVIQFCWKRFSARKQLQWLRAGNETLAASKIQLCWKRHLARQVLSKLRSENALKLNSAATIIQCSWRVHVASKILTELKEKNLVRRNVAATTVQCAWRRHKARLELARLKCELLERKIAAATKIQCALRVHFAKQKLEKLKEARRQKQVAAVTKIQTQVRRLLAVRKVDKLRQDLFERKTLAAVNFQKVFRGRLAKKQCQVLRLEVARQKKEREMQLRAEAEEKAARVIQKAFRLAIWRRAVVQMNFVRKTAMVPKSQLEMWQKILLKENAHLMNFKLLVSVTGIQNSLYRKQDLAASIIQERWRAYYYTRKRAATSLQALWRGFKCRKNIRHAAKSKRAVVIHDPQGETKMTVDQRLATKLVEKFDQIQEVNRNAREEDMVGNKILHALENWQKTFGFEIGTYTLFNRCLDASSACVMLVLPGVPMVVDGFMHNNRSVPAMNMALQASEIILSVAKYPEAVPYLQNIEQLIPSVIFNMHISSSFHNQLFLNCCTILWVLAHDELLRLQILAQPDLKYKLTTMKAKVVGKKVTGRDAVELPCLKLHKNPRSFINKQHAFQEVTKILKLKI